MQSPSPRLARFLAVLQVLALTATLAPVPLYAGKGKAKKLYGQSRAAELRYEYDKALELIEQAMIEDPRNYRYELGVRRLRFVAAQSHVDMGRRLLGEGKLEEAAAQFQRAIEIDPASAVAEQQLRRAFEMIEKRDGGEDKDEDLMSSAIDLDRRQRQEMVESLKAPVRLAPLSNQLIDLTMSEQTKVVFETIGKLAGVNVLFDPAFSDKKIDIEIQRATLTEALDYVGLIAETYWKPISRNAIFVTRDDANNRRKFEEEIVKTIYLNNVATPQELQEITTAIRGLTDIRRMFPVSSMNAIILRGTEAKLALAEKVILDIDKARPEVVIDVLVLEASQSKVRDLGLNIGTGGGLTLPVTFNRDAGDDGSSTVRLSDLGSISSRDWSTTLPGAQLTALFNASDTNLMQSPSIRATDGAQASLRIGERFPIASGSFQPSVGGVGGVNPLVNTQFTYEEVGVNLDIQPKIHNDREVSMHIEIEISNIRGFQSIGDIEQPIIGQRTIAHDIRLAEGEASILGGLNAGSTFVTQNGIPFLSEVPILNMIFGGKRVERMENELLIVVIPHIVRLPTIDESNLKAIASGTDQTFQVRYMEDGNGKRALPELGDAIEPKPKGGPPITPSQPTPNASAPEPRPADPEPTPPVATAPVTEAPAPQPAAPAAPAAAAGPSLSVNPPNASVGVGSEFSVSIQVNQAEQLFGMPLRIRYNKAVLELQEVAKGDFLAGPEGTDLIFSRNIRNQVGQAAVNISRFPGTGGADGSGSLLTLTFKAIGPGDSAINVAPMGARNASQQVVTVAAAKADVAVTQ